MVLLTDYEISTKITNFASHDFPIIVTSKDGTVGIKRTATAQYNRLSLGGDLTFKNLTLTVDKAYVLGTIRNLALIKQAVYGLKLGSVLLAAAQNKLAAADVGLQLIFLHGEKIAYLVCGGDADYVRNLLDGKAEILKPKAVHQEVDVP